MAVEREGTDDTVGVPYDPNHVFNENLNARNLVNYQEFVPQPRIYLSILALLWQAFFVY